MHCSSCVLQDSNLEERGLYAPFLLRESSFCFTELTSMAFIPQPNVPASGFDGALFSHNLPVGASSIPDVCPPGVEREMEAFAHQAACIPWPSMPTALEDGPPGVPVDTSSSNNASLCMPNFVPPLPLPIRCGNTTLMVPSIPHEGISSGFSTWPYGSFSHAPLPPHMPPPFAPPLPPLQRCHTPSGPPSEVPRLGSLEETVNVDTGKLSVTCEQKLTVFVGKILPSLSDDIMTSILKLCGSIKSWTRAKDPNTGGQKGFGFCEYESPESLLRALRLLNRLKLEGQELVLKVDKSTLDYLEQYVDKKIQSVKSQMGAEAENFPALKAGHAVKQQTLDVPREVPIEERLGWVFNAENEIDKEVCGNLVNLLEQRNQLKALDLPSDIADFGVGMDDDNAQDPIAEEDPQKVHEWKKFDYDLEKCKLRGQGSHAVRLSQSFYLEYEKLWEEREKAKETQRKSERERDEAIKKMRKRLIKEQEESRTGWKGLYSDERHKRREMKKEKQENDCSLEQKKYVFTATSGVESTESNRLPKGDALMQSKFLDLSTRAKVAFCFKSLSKMKQSDQTHTSTAGGNSLWEENEDNREGYVETKQVMRPFDYTSTIDEGFNETKQVVKPIDYTSTIGNDSFWLQESPAGDGYKQHKPTVTRTSYRNTTSTWERESTSEEQSIDSREDIANEPVNKLSKRKPILTESSKPVNAKELIDKIPRTKDEIFAFSMNWETFDKHGLHERIRPWISKKVLEFLGEEEDTLVDFIITSAKKHMTPTHLLGLLEHIFVEDAELFVVKFWRIVIYEISKAECGLTGG